MLTVHRIGKHCGAELSGVDLSQDLDGDTFAQITSTIACRCGG